MPVKAMMKVGGFVICPFHGNQEPVFIQQVKQAVPPYSQCFTGLSVQLVVQFTSTDSRLSGSGNKIKNLSMILLLFITSCFVLVPRLSALPQELTCTRNCYFWRLTLREDLPGRFFTTLTP